MKVKYLPFQPHCFAFGGFEIQMLNTLNAVIKAGVDADKLDVWSRDSDFDIIHFWGVGPPNYLMIDWAKKSGKLLVATVLLPYHDTVRSKLGYVHRFFKIRQLIHYFSKIDKIVVVNDLQSKILSGFYEVPRSKIKIIPNVIEDKYFETPDFKFSEKYRIENYVLCTGNISPRKNQYNLAQACSNLSLKLVLIGNVLDGESEYGQKIEGLVLKNENILWLRELPKASEELIGAYHSCILFALPSRNETQPISALEAAAMNKPLILLDRKYARQKYYEGAVLCKSPSVQDIEVALKRCIDHRVIPLPNKEILDCTEESVGRSYKNCYTDLKERCSSNTI